MKCLRRRLLIAVGVLAVFGVLFLIAERLRGELGLRAWERERRVEASASDRTGLRPVSGARSSRRLLSTAEALDMLEIDTPAVKRSPTPMLRVTAEKAVIGWQAETWRNAQGRNVSWEPLSRDLSEARTRLRAVWREIAHDPPRVNWADGGDALKVINRAKNLSYVCLASSVLALHEQALDDAFASLRCALALPSLIDDHPKPDYRMARVALEGMALPVTWEVLQADGWTDAQLAQLQHAWAAGNVFSSGARLVNGQIEKAASTPFFPGSKHFSRTELSEVFLQVARSRREGAFNVELPDFLWWLNPVLEKGGEFRALLHLMLWRWAWASQDELNHYRTCERAANMLRDAAREKDSGTVRPTASAARAGVRPEPLFHQRHELGFYDRLRFVVSPILLPKTKRSFDQTIRAEVSRELTVAAIALKRYQLRHGDWPKTLSRLVPNILPRLPLDWYVGAPLRYRIREDGSYLLYSVGPDGKDDHGTVGRGVYTTGRTLLFPKELDILWLSPATPEEAAAARTASRGGRRRSPAGSNSR